MAMKLAEKLRDLNKAAPPPQPGQAVTPQPSQDEKSKEEEKKEALQAKGSQDLKSPKADANKPDAAKTQENLLEKFHLPVSNHHHFSFLRFLALTCNRPTKL